MFSMLEIDLVLVRFGQCLLLSFMECHNMCLQHPWRELKQTSATSCYKTNSYSITTWIEEVLHCTWNMRNNDFVNHPMQLSNAVHFIFHQSLSQDNAVSNNVLIINCIKLYLVSQAVMISMQSWIWTVIDEHEQRGRCIIVPITTHSFIVVPNTTHSFIFLKDVVETSHITKQPASSLFF